jgi:adenine-specific DNA-methyltransferase
MQALERRFATGIETEERFIASGSMTWAVQGTTEMPHVGTDERLDSERRRLERAPTTFPYRLASITYAGSFFGIRQCMEIDSLRFAIDYTARLGDISQSDKEWLLVALGQVASRINNSTGHFAEYLKPRADNLHRILRKRRRSVYIEFFQTLASTSPIGSRKWRARNHAFCSETLSLLHGMRGWKVGPSVIYADPPYSRAQYARYYHVLDVLVEYRYPAVSAEGRYPDQRRRTIFALKAHVVEAIDHLVRSSAELGASMILSYPSNGLLAESAVDPLEIMRRYYHRARLAFSVESEHSTLGAADGRWKVPVKENVYVGFV